MLRFYSHLSFLHCFLENSILFSLLIKSLLLFNSCQLYKGLPVPILLFCSKRKRRGSFGGKAVLFMSGSGNGNLLHLKSSPSSLSQCVLSSKKMALIVSWACQTSLISVPLYYTILCTEDLSFHFFAQITIHSSCLPSNVICCVQLPGLP